MTQNIEHNKHLKQNPYSVPEGYFDKLKADVLEKTHPSKTKVIQLSSRMMKYAAAAVLVLMLAGGWFIYSQNQLSEQEKLLMGVESEIYAYDTELLQYYTETGVESELADADDEYLVKSGYVDEEFLYGNN